MDIDEREPFTTTMPLPFGIVQALGLGALAGALEATALAASLKLPLSAGGFFVLGVVDVLVMTLFAGAVAAVVGAIGFARPGAREPGADPVPVWSWQAAAVVFALTGWYLWFEAGARIDRGDPVVGALALAAMPIGFAGLGYYNARFWFRSVERSHRPWGFPVGAAVGSLALVVAATIGFATRDVGGGQAFDDDKSAVVVTVDGLSADLLPALPTLRGLASRPGGAVFPNAVTPTPTPRGSNASVITGLHPLRHEVVTDSDVLSPRYPTLFSEVAAEGWQTAGFASSPVTARGSGLGEDLDLLDDAFTSSAWLGRIDVVRRVQALLGGGDGHRDAPATLDAFASWLERRDDRPFVAWIHLDDPRHAARTGGDRSAAAARVEAALAALVATLEAQDRRDDTLVVVAGTHGAPGGDARALVESRVNVPIAIDAPGETFTAHDVPAQVRTLDVINTVSEFLGLPPIDTSEGITLLAYGRGERKASMSCTLVGRDGDDGWLLGLRNNGVKYWVDRNGRETLFYLPDDPGETTDIKSDQRDVLDQARRVLVSDRVAMQRTLWRP